MDGLAAVALLAAAIGVTAVLDGRNASQLSGIAQAVDGDTIRISGERLRLTGIDAPELDQTCKDADQRAWPCGLEARAALADLLSGTVNCRVSGRDAYGRGLALCRTAIDRDVARLMVEHGLALATSEELFAAQSTAREAGRGVWRGAFDHPAQWRARQGEVAPSGFVQRLRRWLAGP